ncbi:hypothetical protein DIC82_17995 [Clostridium beijerinckii]|nr:hypothetical protein DIC82_17995 [Clostridium beijerinckii]
MVTEMLKEYHKFTKNDHNHRYKSWEHCYNFFGNHEENIENDENFDYACLHLGFYLASWGMMRGSSFLLQKDYRIHRYFINNVVKNNKYKKYFCNGENKIIKLDDFDGIDEMIEDTISSYENNIYEVNGERKRVSVTDTLCSKILLGVYGIMPAYDRYFVSGIKAHGLKNTNLCEESLKTLVKFYNEFVDEFTSCRELFINDRVYYPAMKLIDMYFWQIGYILENKEQYSIEQIEKIIQFCESYSINHKNVYCKNSKNSKTEKTMNLKNDITECILKILDESKENEKLYLDVSSGEIHKIMGLKNRVPSVCNAMLKIYKYPFEIIKDTGSGMSSTKTLRYYFNK